MPRVIPTETEESIELGDLVEMLETKGFDPRDEDEFATWGEALKKLANNRGFLADIIVEELKERCRNQTRNNEYGAQVIMLHGVSHKFVMRANIWPAMTDSVFKSSGTAPFFYGVPHDHNFSFLTVGYLGPGYWSEYYEFDYEGVSGHIGEQVDLRFVEKSRLEEGKVMLYRAHRDVHNQLAADAMSVTLNIMGQSRATDYLDQYKFDIESATVHSMVNRASIEPLLAVSAHFGGAEGMDLLTSFAAGHPSDRVRFMAVQSLANAEAELDKRIAIYSEATRSPSRFVSEMARAETDKLERGRAWIESQPLVAAA